MVDSTDEALFHGRDAYSSAILQSILILAAQALSHDDLGFLPPGTPPALHVALVGVAALALGFLVLTRHRPRERAAWAVCATLIGGQLLLIPWAALRWHALGRPWEAFLPPQIAMISLGLTVPRSVWLGAGAVLVFFAEGLAIFVYYLAIGTPRRALPVGEPWGMVCYAAVGVAIVVARRQRRRLSLQHIHAEAESAAMTRLSSFLPELIAELSTQLDVVSSGLARLGDGERRPLERGRVAVARLGRLRNRLLRLVGTASDPDAETSPGRRPRDATDERLTLGEQQLYARDAYQSARVVGVMILVAMAASIIAAGRRSHVLQLLWTGHAALTAACLVLLQRTWTRPSERTGFIVFLVEVVPLLVIFVYSQSLWAHGPEAFEPLTATKLLVVVLALAAPRHRWASLALLGLVAAEGFAVFYAYHFDRLRDRMPMSEPWPIVLHLLIGVALLVMREQRRVASFLMLRSELEIAARARHAGVVLALLDQLGTPLQILSLTSTTLVSGQPDEEARHAVAGALQRLASMPGRVPPVDRGSGAYLGLSPNADRELRPSPRASRGRRRPRR